MFGRFTRLGVQHSVFLLAPLFGIFRGRFGEGEGLLVLRCLFINCLKLSGGIASRGFRVFGDVFFPPRRRGQLVDAVFQRRDTRLDLAGFAFELVALAFQQAQGSRGFGFGLTCGFARCGSDLGLRSSLGRMTGGGLGSLEPFSEFGFSAFDMAGRFAPAIEPDRGFECSDGGRELAVASGLARLLLQGVAPGPGLVDYFLQAAEIGLGTLQAKLGLVSPRPQTGDACSFFQHTTAVLRLGRNKLGNLSLADQGW